MRSIYEQALGADFAKLHPRIQQRFGFSSQDRTASIGSGVMHHIWYNKLVALPLFFGTLRHIMFPKGGTNIPFSIENFAYKDHYGRETVTWIRKFQFTRSVQYFDATMVYSGERERIVDYLGNQQHLAVDLEISVSENGGIKICSGDQRFYEGWLQFKCPNVLTGKAEVNEWYDDQESCYKITVEVRNPIMGRVFHYVGSFQAAFITTDSESIPIGIRPLREEKRE
ncbi:DUF4166 domain-containing protein [Paenibacillus luteus]|uniref:DUF4166 domain-containing protein n=1 Tax=Paenibacillus luteus TaxID=2545753 RepID=UPI001141D07E|nr:DUF4166 domain-containing protein [Paenibacillus luteus]